MTIEENKPLQQLNTFGIAATAKYYVEVTSVEDVKTLINEPVFKNNERLILGGGSNILFTKNFDGLVIKNNIQGIAVTEDTERHVVLKANAGVVWHDLVLYTIDKNYAGIENLSLIPGCVGAAPMQNIGAYGVEIRDVFHSLEAVDLGTGEVKIFKLEDCEFGYRESVFKHKEQGRYLIISVSFFLTKLDYPNAIYQFHTEYGDIKNTLAEMRVYEPTLKAVSDAVIAIRSSKLPNPKELGNAGSFFKNPVVSKEKYESLVAENPVMPSYVQKDGTVKIPAGWLIEQCGWKGRRVGNTGSHARQALVLVNYGNAQGNEVWQLAMDIQLSVHDKFGIDISPEVNMV